MKKVTENWLKTLFMPLMFGLLTFSAIRIFGGGNNFFWPLAVWYVSFGIFISTKQTDQHSSLFEAINLHASKAMIFVSVAGIIFNWKTIGFSTLIVSTIIFLLSGVGGNYKEYLDDGRYKGGRVYPFFIKKEWLKALIIPTISGTALFFAIRAFNGEHYLFWSLIAWYVLFGVFININKPDYLSFWFQGIVSLPALIIIAVSLVGFRCDLGPMIGFTSLITGVAIFLLFLFIEPHIGHQ